MKKYLIAALISLLVSGCASSVITKTIKVIADPPDSVIRVVSGPELKEEKFSSPAAITIEVPKEPALAARAFLEVSKEQHKPTTIPLRHISDGDTIKIKLEKLATYRLKYRLLSPVPSEELKFQDKAISFFFAIEEQAFRMDLKNLGPLPLRIRWESAEYTDVFGQPRRLLYSGVLYQNRNNPLPDQLVPSYGTIKETITPIPNVIVSPQTGGYVVKPLFVRNGDGAAALKGRTFNLFIPIEIDRQIIPYNFKFEITDVMKEAMK